VGVARETDYVIGIVISRHWITPVPKNRGDIIRPPLNDVTTTLVVKYYEPVQVHGPSPSLINFR